MGGEKNTTNRLGLWTDCFIKLNLLAPKTLWVYVSHVLCSKAYTFLVCSLIPMLEVTKAINGDVTS